MAVGPVDRINRATYEKPGYAGEYVTAGWLTVGEMNAYAGVASRVRCRRILDLGIGAGRTTGILGLLSDDYVGVDSSAQMIRLARARFPAADLRLADVRDLDEFADGSCSLVSFSFNGLDSLSHQDRLTGLREMVRVLAPHGVLVYSALNLHGGLVRRRPWSPQRRPGLGPVAIAGTVLDMARQGARFPRAMGNYRAAVALATRGIGWGVLPLDAHDFGLLAHFSTLDAIRAEVADRALTLERILATDGRDLTQVGDDDDEWFQIVANKS